MLEIGSVSEPSIMNVFSACLDISVEHFVSLRGTTRGIRGLLGTSLVGTSFSRRNLGGT